MLSELASPWFPFLGLLSSAESHRSNCFYAGECILELRGAGGQQAESGVSPFPAASSAFCLRWEGF